MAQPRCRSPKGGPYQVGQGFGPVDSSEGLSHLAWPDGHDLMLDAVDQNRYLSESCISRAAWALLMMPKFELPNVPLGFPQFTQLNALKASILN